MPLIVPKYAHNLSKRSESEIPHHVLEAVVPEHEPEPTRNLLSSLDHEINHIVEVSRETMNDG